jgi:ribosomal protein S26
MPRPSSLYRAGTAQNISCHAVLQVVPKDRAMIRSQMARPKVPAVATALTLTEGVRRFVFVDRVDVRAM